MPRRCLRVESTLQRAGVCPKSGVAGRRERAADDPRRPPLWRAVGGGPAPGNDAPTRPPRRPAARPWSCRPCRAPGAAPEPRPRRQMRSPTASWLRRPQPYSSSRIVRSRRASGSVPSAAASIASTSRRLSTRGSLRRRRGPGSRRVGSAVEHAALAEKAAEAAERGELAGERRRRVPAPAELGREGARRAAVEVVHRLVALRQPLEELPEIRRVRAQRRGAAASHLQVSQEGGAVRAGVGGRGRGGASLCPGRSGCGHRCAGPVDIAIGLQDARSLRSGQGHPPEAPYLSTRRGGTPAARRQVCAAADRSRPAGRRREQVRHGRQTSAPPQASRRRRVCATGRSVAPADRRCGAGPALRRDAACTSPARSWRPDPRPPARSAARRPPARADHRWRPRRRP